MAFTPVVFIHPATGDQQIATTLGDFFQLRWEGYIQAGEYVPGQVPTRLTSDHIGVPNGIAPLDGDGLVPTENLPAGLGGEDPALTAHLSNMSNPHGTTAAQLPDFAEAVQDAVAAMLVSGANVTLTYNDVAGTLQVVSAGGGDAEVMRDTIGAALVGINGVGVTVNDAADTITLSVSGLTIAQTTGLQAALDAKVATARTIAGLGLSADITAAALKTALGLVKADVGLGNVDNTSDAGKPVSTAQAAAIEAHRVDTTDVHGIPNTARLGLVIVETATGTWSADAPSGRTGGSLPCEFRGNSDPADPTNGIDTPANLRDWDVWVHPSA